MKLGGKEVYARAMRDFLILQIAEVDSLFSFLSCDALARLLGRNRVGERE